MGLNFWPSEFMATQFEKTFLTSDSIPEVHVTAL